MIRNIAVALMLGLLIALAGTMTASAQMNPCNPCGEHGIKFYADDDRNVLTFESKAPLEKIVGTTSRVTGHAMANPDDVTQHAMAKFEVDLASLKTGIGLRDEHMRDNFLETNKYPKAVLTINKVLKTSSKQLVDGKPTTADLEATLELHGVKNTLVLKNAKVTYFKESEATRARLPGDLLRIEAEFSVRLPDYKIKVPKMIILKLDEEIKISVDVFATTVAPKGAENPCNPCGEKAANPCNPCGEKTSNPCGS